MARDAYCLICIFMNINENLKKIREIIKNTINKLISAQNNHQLTIVECFIASEIQFDKPFYLMVLFNNYLICIFMNINENLKKIREIIKNTINKLISAPNHHQTTIVECFIASEIQFDIPFHLMVLYNKYLICIFMNINENKK